MDWRVVGTPTPDLVELGPYVPAISDAGVVAYTATRADGSTAVVVDGRVLDLAAESHPDVNTRGHLAAYTRAGVVRDGTVLSPQHGPLGPTMNNRGDVAWRSDDGVHLNQTTLARGHIEGLPVVNDAGSVAFRTTLPDGRHAIYLDDRLVAAAPALGRFPSLNHRGVVGFVSPQGVHRWRDGTVDTLHEGWDYRGALVDDEGRVVFYATPPGATLGIYARGERVLGDGFDGTTILEFALNPVSINAAGELVVRVRLADGRQLILRG